MVGGRVVGLCGLEPQTLRLSGVRSNHLSYRPAVFETPRSPSTGKRIAAAPETEGKVGASLLETRADANSGRGHCWCVQSSYP
jgi:hypothetical protein